jgi:hypothetical protein
LRAASIMSRPVRAIDALLFCIPTPLSVHYESGPCARVLVSNKQTVAASVGRINALVHSQAASEVSGSTEGSLAEAA